MSTIDSNQSLNAILDKLGVNKQEETTTKRRDQLGQADFSETDDNSASKSGSFCADG